MYIESEKVIYHGKLRIPKSVKNNENSNKSFSIYDGHLIITEVENLSFTLNEFFTKNAYYLNWFHLNKATDIIRVIKAKPLNSEIL